ncbi:MAG: adenylate/guanylate cyclase domain-containing protein [Solirubrobacteraceae bacterium]
MDESSHTFLFADLVGYTALAEQEGDGRALEVALALQRRVRGLLGEHGAEQVKAIGDGLMIRCDRPQDAVLLGLRVVDELEQEGDFPSVRVGIHTGPALANDGDWYGRAVNVASRLCAVAPGGEVMVSEATRAASGALAGVDWGERELHWLRNVSQPIGAYCAARLEQPVARGRLERTRDSVSLLRSGVSRICPVGLHREATA